MRGMTVEDAYRSHLLAKYGSISNIIHELRRGSGNSRMITYHEQRCLDGGLVFEISGNTGGTYLYPWSEVFRLLDSPELAKTAGQPLQTSNNSPECDNHRCRDCERDYCKCTCHNLSNSELAAYEHVPSEAVKPVPPELRKKIRNAARWSKELSLERIVWFSSREGELADAARTRRNTSLVGNEALLFSLLVNRMLRDAEP